MTAQISDIFRFKNKQFDMAGISEGRIFEPEDIQLTPRASCTACWRGYQAHYAVTGDRLILDELHINLHLEDEKGQRILGPPINGRMPTGSKEEYDFFDNFYRKLDYQLPYTGGILLADGFIRDLYVHMGFHPAWKYETVYELIFEDGNLVVEKDCSAEMAEFRNEFIEASKSGNSQMTNKEVEEFVSRAFDRSYTR